MYVVRQQRVKCRRLRWTEQVSSMKEKRKLMRFWCGILKAREHLKNLGIDGRIVLEYIFKK